MRTIEQQKIKDAIKYPIDKYRGWQYKNTFLLIVGLVILIYFADSNIVQKSISVVGNWGFFGAFVVGIFFVSAFTVAPAMFVLYGLADKLNPLGVAVLAGIGAVIGDYLIFRFLKDRIFEELEPLFDKMGGSLIKKLFFTPYFIWLVPFFGAFIIASPLPDEAGISLLGLSKIKNWQFLLLSFILNATGIFIIVTIARAF